MKAISLIIKKKDTGVSFFIYKESSHNDYYCNHYDYIIYFNFVMNGKELQVSFHSFDDDLLKYAQKGGAKHRINWNHKYNGSREACELLFNEVLKPQ